MVAEEKGSISIHTENIFPIIKKFLYSDHEIFLRELVSNAVDATRKLKHLAGSTELDGDIDNLSVTVSLDKEARTITISDEGIGMTADEIRKYINQIAFSGATEFVEKFKGQGEDLRSQIIGNFGLGFYSAFMVADQVEINTRSFQPDAESARWICDGSTEFEIGPGDKATRGTDIILHLSADSDEFLDEYRLRTILKKYCSFLPVTVKLGEEVINETSPAWTKAPSSLTDEDYLAFYRKLYPSAADPLFWIHLNVDYPFNLTGILYFPKAGNNFEVQRDKIQLYSRQVFITDEVKDVVPEFLMLLHGVIDSPDIPLNVSRSFLQADSNVKKINGYITRKVADKLSELFNADRKAYEEKWDNIGLFVKYGIISEAKFAEKATAFALVKNVAGEYYTSGEYKDKVAANQTGADGEQVWLYASDAARQHSYIQAAERRGYDVLLFDSVIDNHYLSHLEQSLEKTHLKRVDSDSADKLIDKGEAEDAAQSSLDEAGKESLKAVFEKSLGTAAKNISFASLSAEDLPVTLTQNEMMRRMKEMYSQGPNAGIFGSMPDEYNVVVNANHPLNAKIAASETDEDKDRLARYAYDLALLSQGRLTGAELSAFISRSLSIVA
ncbi:MAG: molecular chaperone HtpG [Bacteroidota bacterium]